MRCFYGADRGIFLRDICRCRHRVKRCRRFLQGKVGSGQMFDQCATAVMDLFRLVFVSFAV